MDSQFGVNHGKGGSGDLAEFREIGREMERLMVVCERKTGQTNAGRDMAWASRSNGAHVYKKYETV
jgi:hypothetical protein